MNRIYRRLKKIFGGLLRFIFRVKIVNPEKEISGTPFIVCANHTGAFDPVIISAAMKNQICYMAKKEAFKIPIIRHLLKSLGTFPIDRKHGDVGAIKKTIEILKDGGCVGIFPQGTRCPYVDPRMTEVKNGIGMIAARAGVGVLPVYLKTKKNKTGFFKKTRLIIGDYIPPEELDFQLTGKEKYAKISEYVFDKICTLGEEYEL